MENSDLKNQLKVDLSIKKGWYHTIKHAQRWRSDMV